MRGQLTLGVGFPVMVARRSTGDPLGALTFSIGVTTFGGCGCCMSSLVGCGAMTSSGLGCANACASAGASGCTASLAVVSSVPDGLVACRT
jgi:hypothetical protein